MTSQITLRFHIFILKLYLFEAYVFSIMPVVCSSRLSKIRAQKRSTELFFEYLLSIEIISNHTSDTRKYPLKYKLMYVILVPVL